MSGFETAQWLFVKLIGLTYVLAFASLWIQVKGLFGQRGIVPMASLLRSARPRLGKRYWWWVPTLFWWGASDRSLRGLALVGVVAGLAVIAGAPAVPLLGLCWLLYLSYVSVGSPFMNYQWDYLILETGFVALFYAIATPPTVLWQGVVWFLLFRFMFASGIVKVIRGCPQWNSLAAMDYHYETQPLPSRWAWYAHQQPRWISRLSAALVLVLEIGIPFLIFAPTPFRLVACGLMVFLQLLIMITGSYAFFNGLTIALCVPLLPNEVFAGWLGHRELAFSIPYSWGLEAVLAPVALFWFFMNSLLLLRLFFPVPAYAKLMGALSPLGLFNSYGLFAHMTTIRDEIIVEGSLDGETWQPYRFFFKPGDPEEPPRYAAPHQPRLDWQMWFAALGHFSHNAWFLTFIQRLLEGAPEVLALVKENPFPESPPKMIRSQRWRYHFTDWKAGWATGRWWDRRYVEDYTPVVTLEDFT